MLSNHDDVITLLDLLKEAPQICIPSIVISHTTLLLTLYVISRKTLSLFFSIGQNENKIRCLLDAFTVAEVAIKKSTATFTDRPYT